MSGRIAVIDFETTGISPGGNGRATEVGIVMLENGRQIGHFQSLMNAGVRVNSFITQLTGITNAMLQSAPPASSVMREAAEFVGDAALVAHNASFDRKFWAYELGLLGMPAREDFACTMLLARRLLPDAPDHKLGTLNRWARLPDAGRAHRALADAQMAASLWLYLQQRLAEQCGRVPDHAALLTLQKTAVAKVPAWLASWR